MDGLLVVDKPAGPTSHDVVARVRRALGERRIGHTGTLDPAATGILPLVLGRATRLARFLSAGDKSYVAVVRLGIATDTYDAEGTATGPAHEGALPSRDAIEGALDRFRGTFLQQPPAYSAKKIDGRRSYAIARAASYAPTNCDLSFTGAAAPAPVTVTTSRVDLVNIDEATVTLQIDCSAGFYVRALAHDLGERLGTGAHLLNLRRTRSGSLGLDTAIALDAVEREPARAREAIIPVSQMLPELLAIVLTGEGVGRAVHGRDLGPGDLEGHKGGPGLFPQTGPSSFFRLVDPAGDLVAIATPAATSGLLHPAVVLV